jgi:phosphatidylglycerophosphate synthase
MIDKWLSKTKFRKKFESLVAKTLIGNVTANQLTFFGLITGVLSAFSIFLSGVFQTFLFIIISAILLGISFFIDSLDGPIARYGETTLFGGILDIFFDRTVEVFILIALISTSPLILMWPGVFSLGSIILCITMFLIVGGAIKTEELGDSQKVIYYRGSLMERSETFIFLLLLIILIPWRSIILWIFSILVMLTALLRLRDAYIIFKVKLNLKLD